jgi:hypothetical protein
MGPLHSKKSYSSLGYYHSNRRHKTQISSLNLTSVAAPQIKTSSKIRLRNSSSSTINIKTEVMV